MEENQNTTPIDSTTTLSGGDFKTKALAETAKSISDNFLKSVNRVLNSIKSAIVKLKSSRTNTSIGYQNRAATIRSSKSFYKVLLASVVILLLIISFLAGKTTSKSTSYSGSSYAGYSDNRPLGPTVKAGQTLNKEFTFPLLDDNGVKVSEIKYKLTTAEVEDSIIVNGQRANAVKGRTFLVINLEITNNHTQAIQINSRDYLRLSVNGDSDWIAPDIHNDPVQVQAISTKITRLGFPINDSDKDLTLQVGEIKGVKQFVKLNLK